MTRMSLRHNTHDATRNALRTRYVLGDMLGQSPQMEQVRQTILLYARSSAAVLIEGETGTGKELAAQAIHRNILPATMRDRAKVASVCCRQLRGDCRIVAGSRAVWL